MIRLTFPIETERLRLRPVTPGDHDDLFAYYSRPEVCQYLYQETYDRRRFRAALARKVDNMSLRSAGDTLNLALVPRDRGRAVGDVLLHWVNEEHRQGEIGYVLHPDFQGRGYVTEACRALLRIGFADVGLHRIVARLDGRNDRSARVLERLGMRREAHLVENEWVKGTWTDEVIYALLEGEWREPGSVASAHARTVDDR